MKNNTDTKEKKLIKGSIKDKDLPVIDVPVKDEPVKEVPTEETPKETVHIVKLLEKETQEQAIHICFENKFMFVLTNKGRIFRTYEPFKEEPMWEEMLVPFEEADKVTDKSV